MENLVKAQKAVEKAQQMYIEFQKETQKIRQILTEALQEFATKNQIHKVQLHAFGEENSFATSFTVGTEYRLYCFDESGTKIYPDSEDYVLLKKLCDSMSKLAEEVLYNDESIVVFGTRK